MRDINIEKSNVQFSPKNDATKLGNVVGQLTRGQRYAVHDALENDAGVAGHTDQHVDLRSLLKDKVTQDPLFVDKVVAKYNVEILGKAFEGLSNVETAIVYDKVGAKAGVDSTNHNNPQLQKALIVEIENNADFVKATLDPNNSKGDKPKGAGLSENARKLINKDPGRGIV